MSTTLLKKRAREEAARVDALVNGLISDRSKRRTFAEVADLAQSGFERVISKKGTKKDDIVSDIMRWSFEQDRRPEILKEAIAVLVTMSFSPKVRTKFLRRCQIDPKVWNGKDDDIHIPISSELSTNMVPTPFSRETLLDEDKMEVATEGFIDEVFELTEATNKEAASAAAAAAAAEEDGLEEEEDGSEEDGSEDPYQSLFGK